MIRYHPASGRSRLSRVVRGLLSAVRRVPLRASRSMCACVRQLKMRDKKPKTPMPEIHVACMARPSGTGCPVKSTPLFQICKRAAPAEGLGRDPEGTHPSRSPTGRARRRRDWPGGRRAKTRRRDKKNTIMICNIPGSRYQRLPLNRRWQLTSLVAPTPFYFLHFFFFLVSGIDESSRYGGPW